MKYISIFSLILLFLISCKTENKQDTKENKTTYKEALKKIENKNFHIAKALESVTSGGYTYVKLIENGHEFWAAVSAQPINVGQNYKYKDAFEMRDFQSKSLDRVFQSIWFINNFYPENLNTSNPASNNNHTKSNNKKTISIETVKGGYSLAYIFEHKTELKNKEILVKGQVVKINQNIMKTNWIHIQDGTAFRGVYDLTITSQQNINYQVGDIITFKGTLILNRDFGAGYQYDYLLENAMIQ